MKPKSTLRNFLLTAGSSLFAMSYSHAASGNWTATGGGNWSTATSWSSNPTVPGTAAGDIIGLTSNIGAAANVTINTTPRTVGILNIGDSDNTHAFTVNASGGGTLTFNNGGSGAQINEVGSVGDTISAPITLADNLAITAVGTLSMTGIIGETGGARSITMTGGALTLNTGNTYSGGITLNSVFLTIPAGTYGGFGSGTFTTTVGSLALAGDSSMTIGNALNWGGSLTLQRSGGSANALPTFSGDSHSRVI